MSKLKPRESSLQWDKNHSKTSSVEKVMNKTLNLYPYGFMQFFRFVYPFCKNIFSSYTDSNLAKPVPKVKEIVSTFQWNKPHAIRANNEVTITETLDTYQNVFKTKFQHNNTKLGAQGTLPAPNTRTTHRHTHTEAWARRPATWHHHHTNKHTWLANQQTTNSQIQP